MYQCEWNVGNSGRGQPGPGLVNRSFRITVYYQGLNDINCV